MDTPRYVAILLCVFYCDMQIQTSFATDCYPDPEGMPWCGVTNNCPSTTPFMKVIGSKKECVSTCGPGEVLRDTFCVDVEKCLRPIVSDGHCLEICPEGYLFYPDSFSELFITPEQGTSASYNYVRVYKHTKGEETRIRCHTTLNCVVAILKLFGLAFSLSCLLYVYLHPRPFCVTALVKLVHRWKKRQALRKMKDLTAVDAADAAADDNDETLLTGNINAQNFDDEVIVV